MLAAYFNVSSLTELSWLTGCRYCKVRDGRQAFTSASSCAARASRRLWMVVLAVAVLPKSMSTAWTPAVEACAARLLLDAPVWLPCIHPPDVDFRSCEATNKSSQQKRPCKYAIEAHKTSILCSWLQPQNTGTDRLAVAASCNQPCLPPNGGTNACTARANCSLQAAWTQNARQQLQKCRL